MDRDATPAAGQGSAGQKTSVQATSKAWSAPVRTIVSLLLVWHLSAVLIGPLSLPPAIIPSAAQRIFGPYAELIDINHAYKFFAPEPGPSHLIDYDIEFADGSHRTGRFPDRHKDFPRLLYHRHFMLTEFIASAPPDENAEIASDWRRQPPSNWQREYARSYAEHMLQEPGAKRVTLKLVQHMLPSPDQVLNKTALDHPDSYRSRLLGTFVGAKP
jgi:hypothetical protein